MRTIEILKRAVIGLGFAVGMSQFAAAQTGAGTYTGTYSGADHGSISVNIDQNGAVTCALTSAAGNGKYTGSGGILSQNPFVFSCTHRDLPGYLNIAGSGTPGGKLTGQYTSNASLTSDPKQGNFTVSPAGSGGGGDGGAYQPTPQSVSGLWYDPAADGTGFNFLMADIGLIATYYGRDAGGGMLWMISSGGPTGALQTNTQYSLLMEYTTAGSFATPSSQVGVWGLLSLTFTGCNRASATLTGEDGVRHLNLQRLAGVAGSSGC